MGITGLLPLLKSIHKHCNLKKFAGQTIGVDAYGWLHRGTVACAIDLALDKPTAKYVDFAMHRVRMLMYFGVTPYLVFDGDNLPSKAGTESDRAKKREESKRRGLELYKAGKISQAHQELQKAVDVTPYMARQLIEELKRLNIQYVVAPYEADAQLTYLEAKGIINGILSEDSDLLVFGAKRLLTKLDQHGDCVEINRTDFASCREISLGGWSDADFRRMAILSGCDYLPSINKMGLKTAYRYVRKYKSTEKVLRMLQFEGQLTIPSGYLEKYQQAELTFLHHRVFCPISKRLVFLTELESGTKEEDLPFVGKDVDPEIAVGVACGDLDPTSKAPIAMRAAVPSSRLNLSAHRRQTLPATVDLKPNKSLDSFFRPKREPLAELDPNSLTPSPSQQRLLAANANASWEARTTSSAPQLGRSSSSMSQPGANGGASLRSMDRVTFLARASAISTYHAPKRQRLCSDAEEPLATGGANKSRFFDSKIEEPSPSVRKKGASKKARKSDFGIFSDDSVDGILLGLPDVTEPVKHSSCDKVQCRPVRDVVVDQEPSIYHDSGLSDDAQAAPESSPMRLPDAKTQPVITWETSVSSTAMGSQSSISRSASNTMINAGAGPEAFEDLLEYHVQKQNEVLRKTFVWQSPSRRASALSTLKGNAINDSPRSPIKPLATMKTPQGAPENAGTAGVDESGSLSDTETYEKLRKTFGYQPSSQQATALRSLGQSQDHAQLQVVGPFEFDLTGPQLKPKVPVLPMQRLGQQAVRKTRSYLGTKVAPQLHILPGESDTQGGEIFHETASGISNSYTLKGSEDLFVPDSEDDNESDRAEEAAGGMQRHLDLTNFAFPLK